MRATTRLFQPCQRQWIVTKYKTPTIVKAQRPGRQTFLAVSFSGPLHAATPTAERRMPAMDEP